MEDLHMAEAANKTPAKPEKVASGMPAPQVWQPFESLRREVDRLFEDFDRDFWRMPFRRSAFETEPFWRRELSWAGTPAVDIVEKDNAYEITADLPGLDEKNVEVKLSNGNLTLKGEKQEAKEEKKKDYYLKERHFGTFERMFRVPEGVDTDKIEAKFDNGVLTVTLPKMPEAQKPSKKIEVKAS
jgi:HSP20 family protein